MLVLALSSFFLAGVFRKKALEAGDLDHPNHRSAHSHPIPTGGGASFVIVFCLALLVLWLLNIVASATVMAFLFAGALVSLVGYLDDRFTLSPVTRLIAQFVAATWGLIWLSGIPNFGWTEESLIMVFIVNGCAILYLVWLTNLYNFMDGIDGVASIQAISVALGLVVTQFFLAADLNWILIILSASIAGFLVWNFPKARLFMGDVGSGFVGLILGLVSIQLVWSSVELFFSFLIVMAVFIMDASLTLARRLMRGEKVYLAHNLHAYQYAARKYKSHVVVSLFIMIFNIAYLLPLAIAVSQGELSVWWGTLLAYMPTLLIAVYFKAGVRAEVVINGSHG